MRVLFSTTHGSGHWHPLVPFADALQQAGHDVAFATTPATCTVVSGLGYRCFVAGRDETLTDTRDLRDRMASMPGAEGAAWAWKNRFAGNWVTTRLPDLLAILEDWAPGLLVREDLEFAGCIAAERCQVPHAAVQVTAWRPWFHPLIAASLARLRESVGLPPDPDLTMLFRYLLLVPAPPSFHDPAHPFPSTARAVRHIPFDRSGDERLPTWVTQLGHQPVVYVTMGTAFNRVPGIFEAIAEGLQNEPVSVIMTIGRDQDAAIVGPLPLNIRVEHYIPQSLVFPHCDVVLTHGGSGTVLTALSHGLPMVIVPISADQPDNARRCEQLGVAKTIPPDRRTKEAFRQAVAEVLIDPGYRRNAQRLKMDMERQPGPEAVVGWLERLAIHHHA